MRAAASARPPAASAPRSSAPRPLRSAARLSAQPDSSAATPAAAFAYLPEGPAPSRSAPLPSKGRALGILERGGDAVVKCEWWAIETGMGKGFLCH